MSERASHNFGDLEIDLARRIDEVCRRFEADWRAGRRPRVEDYLGEVLEAGRPALRAELIALECELRPFDETIARPEAGAATPSAAEAPTIAPCTPPTVTMGESAPSSIHEEATLFPRDEATVDLGPSLDGEPALGAGLPTPPQTKSIRYFGDYEVIRELARGGMGVVFEARQTSLNRKVALKMILAGQLADDDAVRRFYIEAEAAANLDHPGIVPIYEVGQHDGQHYFSMGFVEGQSLAQRLAAAGPLPAREAAELISRVSEAIEYAHQRGVIHRDLKPANILLDAHGNPRVTDFGLAKKVEGDSGLTGSGQIMGTPSYMPPEQAGGKRGDVGPAADVYALGATLYALVTGRPPFQAASVMDTVIQVINEDPVPPRRLNPTVPRDLETIVLKCLEKVPARRYASASALADELRRFLNGEPILARPVGPAERAWRWSRRKPLAATLLAVVAVLTAGGTITITALWLRAERSRSEAVAAGRRAEHSRLEAVASGQRAEANAAAARQAVNDYLNRITTSPQLQRPGLSGLRRDLLTRALTYYETFLRDSASNPELKAEAADAQNHAAMILGELGDTNRAVEAGRRAVELNEQLLKEQPGNTAHNDRYRLASSLNSLGNALRVTRQSDQALVAYRRAAELHEAVAKDDPSNLDCGVDLAVAWSNMAKTLGNTGRTAEEETLLARIQKHLEHLVPRAPEVSKPRELLADNLHTQGDLAADRGEFDKARGLYLRSVDLREAMVNKRPDDWGQQTQLARIYNELGLLHFHFNKPQEAFTYYNKSRDLRERLLAAEPASAELQEYLARSLANLGNLYNSLGRPAEAVPILERCRDLRARMVAASPDNAEMQGSLGGSLHNLAMSHEQLGHDVESKRLYEQALEHQRRARAIQPEIVVHRLFYTNHLLGLGGVCLRAGKFDEAARLADEAASLWTREASPLVRSAILMIECVRSTGPGNTPEAKARRDRFGQSAVAILNKSVDGGFRDPSFFHTSSQLDPIRNRDDFKALIARFKELIKAPSSAPKATEPAPK